ncbi:MAG: diguanylate cyclase [Amphritea sp.]|nr:diguanylate cyclase [Amphritea sp.]
MTCIRPYLLMLVLLLLSGLFPAASWAAAPVQVIQGSAVKLEQFQMGYFVDETQQMTFDEVLQQSFKVSKNSISLGTHAKTTWVKIEVENSNATPFELYLHHPYAYHNRAIELYEIVDGRLTRERVLDTDDKNTLQWMYRGSAVFDIALQPHQRKTLLVKSIAYSHQWFALNLYDADQSKRVLLSQSTDISLLVGMLLALIIYNLLLFLSSRLKEHFYYACYLICGGYWIALSYGLIADVFEVYGATAFHGHLALGGIPIFLLLFMMTTFETKRKYPIEHKALLWTLIILVGDTLYGLFDIVSALQDSTTFAALMMVVTLSVSVSMLIRKHPVALYFLLGHGLFVIFSVLAVLFYRGEAEFNYINTHGVGIGIMLEALMLSLIIAYRIRSLESMKATQLDLQLLASTDPLTQLLNRRSFNTAASRLLEHAAQTGQPTSVVIIDIDDFKRINDSYGHVVGDKAIKQLTDVIRSHCRCEDVLARYGGDELVILMPNTLQKEGYIVAERIRQTLEHTAIKVDPGESVYMTISIGITEVEDNRRDVQEAISRADKALYQAKNNGRNQSQLFTE